jgi:hypothetical protein
MREHRAFEKRVSEDRGLWTPFDTNAMGTPQIASAEVETVEIRVAEICVPEVSVYEVLCRIKASD